MNIHIQGYFEHRSSKSYSFQKRPDLVETLRHINPILDHLRADDVINMEENDRIQAARTPQDAARELLDILEAKARYSAHYNLFTSRGFRRKTLADWGFTSDPSSRRKDKVARVPVYVKRKTVIRSRNGRFQW
ncbi:Hypp6283 [Branchiostoma lanceolatum]|uniref:Hypp6283 protein n=1 Tax=Branchiostoma lanceolatum TaxID=7740 RepID=A0A8J9YNV4_BRALA|nr:Hypp6283 [Branchiostoma lanceolatum]